MHNKFKKVIYGIIYNMYKKWAGYMMLSFASFCVFTALFHSVVSAQVTTIPVSPLAEKLELKTITAPPKPDKYFAPTKYLLPVKVTPSIFGTFTQPGEEKSTNSVLQNEKQPLPSLLIPVSPVSNEVSTITSTIAPTNASSVKLTIAPTSTPENTPAPTLSTTAEISGGGLDAQKLFSMANAHRQKIGIPILQKDEKTCSLAQARAPEIAGEMAKGTLHSGMYGRNLTYWNTENAIAMGPEEAAFAWWLGDPIHRQAIENPSHIYSCVACSGVYCVQEFTSYQPK